MNLFFNVGVAESLLCIMFFGTLVTVSIFDLYKMKIPDFLCVIILVVGIISMFFMKDIKMVDRLLGIFVVSTPMFAIAMLARKGFGGGDIKLMAASGIFMGAKLIIVSFILAMIMAGIYIIISYFVKNKSIKNGFALGPCFSIGMIISCMLGKQIWNLIL